MEVFYEQDSLIKYLSFKNKKIQSKKKLNYSLTTLLTENTVEEGSKKVFLIDEDRFNIFNFSITKNFNNKISLSDIKEIVKNKKANITTNHWNVWKFLYYNIENIFINWEQKDFLIWQSWKINFQISFFYLDFETVNLFKKFAGNKFLTDTNLQIYPASLFTNTFIKRSTQKENIALLYILNKEIKLIIIKDSKIKKIEKLSLGLSHLKEIFKESGNLEAYFSCLNSYKNYSWIGESIIVKNLSFYCWTITKRLKDNLPKSYNIVLLSKLTKSEMFWSIFSKNYCQQVWWYIIPFEHKNNFNSFWYKFEKDEVDLLAFLNSIE